MVSVVIQTASFGSRGGLYIVRARDTALFTIEPVAPTHKDVTRHANGGTWEFTMKSFDLIIYEIGT